MTRREELNALADMPEKPEGWIRSMVYHMNFGREGGLASYEVFDADGRKVPFRWGYDTREGGGRGFYIPSREGYHTWQQVREHYRALAQEAGE
jgi:hypothetical protein